MDATPWIDADPFASRNLTGIGRYVARLALALAERSPVRFFSQDREIVVPEGLSFDPDQDLASWTRRIWRGRRVDLGDTSQCVGIYGGPRGETRRFPVEVGVLHDLTPLILPETHSKQTLKTFRAFFTRGLLACDRVIAVSEATRADSRWLTDLPEEKVRVAPSGPSLCLSRHLHSGSVHRDPRLGIVVSTLEPRKNPFFLLDWFLESTSLPEDAELMWVGPVGWLTSPRRLRAYRKSKGRKVRFFGMVSDERLCGLYRRAGWSVYPSLYEGFGFPVLDALRHGVPVLAAGNSSLVEFEGPGVTFFDPCDRESLEAAWGTRNREIDLSSLNEKFFWSRVVDRILGGEPTSSAVKQPGAILAA